MIGRWGQSEKDEVVETPKGFDDYDLRLGDVMRGERATMGKSLLDVQRELKIKAAYIAAIENADPSAFDTPGFIAGFVRSYARYLNLDPDWAFQTFCDEAAFEPVHGMSTDALPLRKAREDRLAVAAGVDPLATPNVPFRPATESVLDQIEPRAIGSSLVLLLLIGGLGFGGWSVLQEVQRVNVAPVDQAPRVVSQLDPLAEAVRPATAQDGGAAQASLQAGLSTPATDTLDRLYRPQALDVPVMVARDAPIATLNPDAQGVFAAAATAPRADTLPSIGGVEAAVAEAISGVQVVEPDVPEVVLFAVRGSWVRVRAADGSILLEKVLDAGEEYVLPTTEEAASIERAGNSGSLYFKVNGDVYGPAGPGTTTAKAVTLSVEALQERYEIADLTQDDALAQFVAVADAGAATE
ncbi:MAG: helix-turn-helix domain-containing protein [Pseudomonadota bacterium]